MPPLTFAAISINQQCTDGVSAAGGMVCNSPSAPVDPTSSALMHRIEGKQNDTGSKRLA